MCRIRSLIKSFTFNDSGNALKFGACLKKKIVSRCWLGYSPFQIGRRREAWTQVEVMLLRAPSKDDNLGGLKQNCKINEQRHVFQVKQVKFEFPFRVIEAGTVAKPHLRPSR